MLFLVLVMRLGGCLLIFMGLVLVGLGRFVGFLLGVMLDLAFFQMLATGLRALVFGSMLGFRVMRFGGMLFGVGLAGFGVRGLGFALRMGGRLGSVAGRGFGAGLVQRLGGRRGLEVAGQRLVFRLCVAQGAGDGQADGDERAYQLDQVHCFI
ncbi:hypothetical protein [Chromobacterium violaceum]|uniref:hypothetical protein n=1 Tax=Chromobacterium violaceum TaxID=536 RepID=UPI001124FB93|nr:hypothetical protein [Chromobacterium violaceum]